MKEKKKIVVLVPCYNEELTVEKVVSDFKKELPEADIYVYNNNSKDKTAELALKAGAIVRNEYQQGKGNVVRSMFRDIDADVYIMVDGDDTYPADEVKKLIEPVLEGRADMVIGDRLSNGTYASENKRGFHNLGNNLVRSLINLLFHSNINDIMTGYRGFSKKFVKGMPVMSNGFQIETEMTIFSLVYGMNLVEVPIIYRDRPQGSESKLNTFSDGFKVLMTIAKLCIKYHPLFVFGILSLLLFIIGLCLGIPVLSDLSNFGETTRIASATISIILGVLSIISITLGIILNSIQEQTRFLYECHINQVIEHNKEK